MTLRETDEREAVGILSNMIAMTASKFSIPYNMNREQVAMCAAEIYQEIALYTLEDIDKILKKGARGEYGPLFNRFDQSVIFDWIRQYGESENKPTQKMKYNPHVGMIPDND